MREQPPSAVLERRSNFFYRSKRKLYSARPLVVIVYDSA